NVVNGPSRHLEAVDRVGRVVWMMEVQGPGHLAALRWHDRLQAQPASLRISEVRVITARQQGEHPQDLTRGLRARKVDLPRLRLHVGILARPVSLTLDCCHTGGPRGTST